MTLVAPFLSERQTRLGGYGSSSIGRVAVSKTVGWGFKSLLPCQPSLARSQGGRKCMASCGSASQSAKRRGGRVVYRGGLENRFG